MNGERALKSDHRRTRTCNLLVDWQSKPNALPLRQVADQYLLNTSSVILPPTPIHHSLPTNEHRLNTHVFKPIFTRSTSPRSTRTRNPYRILSRPRSCPRPPHKHQQPSYPLQLSNGPREHRFPVELVVLRSLTIPTRNPSTQKVKKVSRSFSLGGRPRHNHHGSERQRNARLSWSVYFPVLSILRLISISSQGAQAVVALSWSRQHIRHILLHEFYSPGLSSDQSPSLSSTQSFLYRR